MATHAVGFRVYNDAALIIAALRQAEVRKVAHVDVDANHDNGVQTAFEATRVLTESIHQSPMSLFHPYTRAANRMLVPGRVELSFQGSPDNATGRGDRLVLANERRRVFTRGSLRR